MDGKQRNNIKKTIDVGFVEESLLSLEPLRNEFIYFRQCSGSLLLCAGFLQLQLVRAYSLVAPCWSRGRTHIACIGRQILKHWTTREVQS